MQNNERITTDLGKSPALLLLAPPGSFPGGETLGLPPGTSIPGPFSAQVLFGLYGWDCSTGVCVPGLGPSADINRNIPATCGPYLGGPCPNAGDYLRLYLMVRALNWPRAGMYAACLAGAEPSYMTSMGRPQVQDASDSIPETQGPTVFYGSGKGRRNGGQAPINPSGGSQLPDNVSGGANYFSNTLQCIANVSNYQGRR